MESLRNLWKDSVEGTYLSFFLWIAPIRVAAALFHPMMDCDGKTSITSDSLCYPHSHLSEPHHNHRDVQLLGANPFPCVRLWSADVGVQPRLRTTLLPVYFAPRWRPHAPALVGR